MRVPLVQAHSPRAARKTVADAREADYVRTYVSRKSRPSPRQGSWTPSPPASTKQIAQREQEEEEGRSGPPPWPTTVADSDRSAAAAAPSGASASARPATGVATQHPATAAAPTQPTAAAAPTQTTAAAAPPQPASAVAPPQPGPAAQVQAPPELDATVASIQATCCCMSMRSHVRVQNRTRDTHALVLPWRRFASACAFRSAGAGDSFPMPCRKPVYLRRGQGVHDIKRSGAR